MLFISVIFVLFAVVVGGNEIDQMRNIFDYDLYENVLDPDLCQLQLKHMYTYQFYDASLRIPQGFLTGTFSNLGNYPQCIGISQPFNETIPIEGKYCIIRVPMNQIPIQIPSLPEIPSLPDLNITWPWKLNKYDELKRRIEIFAWRKNSRSLGSVMDGIDLDLGLCIPKSCTSRQALSPYVNNFLINFTYTEVFCRLPNDRPFVPGDYVAIVIFSLLGFLVIVGTSYELCHLFLLKKDPKKANEILQCFSIFTNTSKLLTFTNNSNTISCLDGLRSISILWVIIGHTFTASLSGYVQNMTGIYEFTNKRRSLWIMSANISVDTFFTLSGCLLVYTAARKMKPMALLKNIHLFYLNRILRMFPLLSGAVLLQATLLNHITDGPNWHVVGEQVRYCRQYWWSALLHVQNIVNPRDICLPHTWYLSVDVQLHILSPLLLFWVLDSRRSAWTGLAAAMLISLTALTVYCFINNFPSTHWMAGNSYDEVMRYVVYYYNNTLTRAPPFIVGMIFGYLLHTLRKTEVRLPLWFTITGYLMAFLVSFQCIYYVYPISRQNWNNQLADNFINSFMRTGWALSIGWLIFACATGYGGPINWFLSLKMWQFVARISYAMYIFHYPIQFINTASRFVPVYFSIPNFVMIYINELALTLMVSVVACVIIDMPFSTLQKMLLEGKIKKQSKSTETNANGTESAITADIEEKKN